MAEATITEYIWGVALNKSDLVRGVGPIIDGVPGADREASPFADLTDITASLRGMVREAQESSGTRAQATAAFGPFVLAVSAHHHGIFRPLHYATTFGTGYEAGDLRDRAEALNAQLAVAWGAELLVHDVALTVPVHSEASIARALDAALRLLPVRTETPVPAIFRKTYPFEAFEVPRPDTDTRSINVPTSQIKRPNPLLYTQPLKGKFAVAKGGNVREYAHLLLGPIPETNSPNGMAAIWKIRGGWTVFVRMIANGTQLMFEIADSDPFRPGAKPMTARKLRYVRKKLGKLSTALSEMGEL